MKDLLSRRLITVQVTYYFPDHPSLLQIFVWQNTDIPPHFPRLKEFLEFWKENVEAKVHSVDVAYSEAPWGMITCDDAPRALVSNA